MSLDFHTAFVVYIAIIALCYALYSSYFERQRSKIHALDLKILKLEYEFIQTAIVALAALMPADIPWVFTFLKAGIDLVADSKQQASFQKELDKIKSSYNDKSPSDSFVAIADLQMRLTNALYRQGILFSDVISSEISSANQQKKIGGDGYESWS